MFSPMEPATALSGSASAAFCWVKPTVASEPPPISLNTSDAPMSSTSVATVVMMNALERNRVLTSRPATSRTASADPNRTSGWSLTRPPPAR